MEELENAGKQLRLVLDQYLSICLKVHGLLVQKGTLRNVPQKYLRHIDTELVHFPSYEQKFKQAHASICRVRNRLFRLTSISSLPPEILTHIFYFVASPCDILVPTGSDSDSDSDSETETIWSEVSDVDSRRRSKTLQLENFPTHLDCITQVCSYWRWVAIGTPSLWAHIDFVPNKSFHRGFLSRAETYAARSLRLPIELHIADDDPLEYSDPSLRQFLSSNFNRIRSLDIVIAHTWRRFHSLILNEFFTDHASQPIALTKLATSFPMADDELDEFIDWLDDTNDRFSRLKILHLHGLFPLWKSTAYHNLVDLRLTAPSDARWTCILESQLRDILEASPKLRIFYFALRIIERKEDDELVIPVHLDDLEVLSISTDRGEEDIILKPGHVLRLLAPGSKPLRLSIWHIYWFSYDEDDDDVERDDFTLNELVKFFQRSNITKLCVKEECPPLDRLLCHASNLEDLALENCLYSFNSMKPFRRGSPTVIRLNTLLLRDCSPTFAQLELLLQEHPTNLLILSNCNWSQIQPAPRSQDPVKEVLALLGKYPNTRLVEYKNQSYDPVANWDLID
ncbi:unnamed protein product [Rhizoctonia solani]|uniref:F-box domain-containing protein n=1 Tax=Rhizoctonia solani TaxID=456999 RepID=A0A8H3CYH7_9AGAM|nr:unnamed protein product [Rhizoctonia solani]